MTAPASGALRPGAGGRLRRWLGLVNAASAALAVLFLAGVLAGLLILAEGVPIGALLMVAYLLGALLAVGIWLAGRRARAAAVGDTIDPGAVVSARRSGRTLTRWASLLTLLIVLAGVAFSVVTSDISQALLALLGALPILSLSSVARGLARRLGRLPLS